MSIEREASEYMRDMKTRMMPGQIPPRSFGIIENLLLEIRCLRIQVVDRGNSYEQVSAELAEAVVEIGQLKQGLWPMKDKEIEQWKFKKGGS